MASPTIDNILQQVQTYQMSNLAYLQNLNCFIATANTRFKDFDKIEANLGSTVTFDLPPRFVTSNSLVATFQPAVQRIQSLTVNNAYNTSYVFSAEQFIFNVRDYMDKFGKAATVELGAQIEANVALNAVTNTFRFYGNGLTPINSYQQLAQALAMFRNFGAVHTNTKGYIADTIVPSIINSGLQQFALDRNNEIAHSWELGEFSRCDWYQSNLLPIHQAGDEGVNNSTLTVVSTTLNAAGQVTAITFSGTHAATDANSVFAYDKFQFNDGVAGQPNMRYLTFTGHQPSANPVQFMATANAASTGGSQVTVSIYPYLQSAAGANQNINNAIVAGMQVSVLPSHRAGLITAGDPLFLAMPRLPEEVPFPTASRSDPDTGVALRMYYGSKFGQDQRGMIHDCVWGSTLVPEYSMMLAFPV
jgi:P22 coat protein - gene protein 5